MIGPLLLLLASSPAVADPVEMTCCSGSTSSRSLKHYLRVRSSLLAGDASWNAQLSAWAPLVRKPQDATTPHDRAVYKGLYDQLWALRSKNDSAQLTQAFPEISRRMAYLVLRQPGGTRAVAEATCGEQYWLQPIDEPLVPLVQDGCTAAWVMER